MKILKCHKCNHVWLYSGAAASHCTCPEGTCRTTVRLHRQVPVRWDLTPAAVFRERVSPDVHHSAAATIGGQAYGYVDVFDRSVRLAFKVFSQDVNNVRVLLVSQDLVFSWGVTQDLLHAAVVADGGDLVQSGQYALTPELVALIRPQFAEG